MTKANCIRCIVILSVGWSCFAAAASGQDAKSARRNQLVQRLSAIWEHVNRQWRDHHQKLVTQVEVLPVSVKPASPPAGFHAPPSARNVVARDGIYYRDGRPTFLFGVEGRMYDGPWMNRILGIDFYAQHSGMVWWRSAMQVSESPGPRNGVKLSVSFRDYPWAPLLARETLRGGTLFAIDFYLNKSGDGNLSFKKYCFEPPVWTGPRDYDRGTGHFLDLRLENPGALSYYTSQYKFAARLLAPYPVLHYELINEIRYVSYHVYNIIQFQDRMKAKYETIDAANEAWKTSFKDFGHIVPPITVDPGGFLWKPVQDKRWDEGKIMADWGEFMAAHGADMFMKLRKSAEQVVGKTLFTIQTPYVQGGSQLLPYLKVRSEDVYGHEGFFYPYRSGEAGKEDWAKILALMSLQYNSDLTRNAAPDKPIINLEAPFVCAKRARWAASAVGVHEGAGPAGPNFIRMFFWHQLAHGLSGSVLSYFYTNECSDGGDSVWDPEVMTRQAVREIPRVRAEIRDLATVVMPRPRIRGRLGVVHSFETCMEGRRDFLRESMGNYAAAVLTRVPVDLVKTQDILDDKSRRYPVLFLNHCIRFPHAGLAKLDEYVRGGGTLVMTYDSLTYDERVQPFDLDSLLGVRREGTIDRRVRGTIAAIGPSDVAPVQTRMTSPSCGYRVTLTSAEALGDSSHGPPATVHKLGKGRVIYIAWHLRADATRKLLSYVCSRAGVEPEVDVRFQDDIAADYVETHLFGKEGSGRYVLYALNFGGGPRRVRLVPRRLAHAAGRTYFVRNARTRQCVAPNGTRSKVPWSVADLLNGIPASLAAQDPELLLVERTDLQPLVLNGLTQEQEEVLRLAWRDSSPSSHRMLIDGYHVAEFRVSKPKMPTAVKLLEDEGWEVNSGISRLGEKLKTFSSQGISEEDLASYDVLVLCGLRHGGSVWRNEEVDTLRRFVRNGGGLLVCIKRDWHWEASFYEELKGFGIGDAGGNIYDPQHCIMNEPLYVTLSDAAAHPVTRGVERFQTTGIRPLDVTNKYAKVLLTAGENAEVMDLWGKRRPAPNAPIAVALEYGDGRIVVIGTDTWLRPDELEMGDNKVLLTNVLNWLGKRQAD